MSKAKQLPKPDAIGRIYWKRPGLGPLDVEVFEADDVRDMALAICGQFGRIMLEDHIIEGTVIFKRSDGRREMKMQPAYTHSLKGFIRVLVKMDWVYCVEVTKKFYELNLEAQYECLLDQLKRIPEEEELTGKLIRYNAFSGFDQDLDKIKELLPSTD